MSRFVPRQTQKQVNSLRTAFRVGAIITLAIVAATFGYSQLKLASVEQEGLRVAASGNLRYFATQTMMNVRNASFQSNNTDPVISLLRQDTIQVVHAFNTLLM